LFDQNRARPVIITLEGIKMNGSIDTNISLAVDPNDQEYTFKGKGESFYYILKKRKAN
jgi:hypothetical protein